MLVNMKINVIHYIKRIMDTDHIIISLDSEKKHLNSVMTYMEKNLKKSIYTYMYN